MNAVSYGLPDAAYFNLSDAGSDTRLDRVIGAIGEILAEGSTSRTQLAWRAIGHWFAGVSASASRLRPLAWRSSPSLTSLPTSPSSARHPTRAVRPIGRCNPSGKTQAQRRPK